MRDSDLQDLLAEERRRVARAERGCPSAADLAAAALAGKAVERHAELLAHFEICPDCAAEYVVASALDDWAQEAARRLERPRAADLTRVRRRLALGGGGWLRLAAALTIVAAAFLVSERWRGAEREPLRGAAVSAWTVEPGDGERLAEAPRRFAWGRVPEAETYEVVLYDRASRPLWRSAELAVSRCELPQEAALERGRTYFWRVTAHHGVASTRSPLFEFYLER